MCPLTSSVVHVHEDDVVVGSQDGVELLVTHSGELGHVPVLSSAHRHVDHTLGALGHTHFTLPDATQPTETLLTGDGDVLGHG